MAVPAPGQAVLETQALTLRRPAAGLALSLPALHLESGASLAWLGPSGVGKTTALAALLGLLRAPAVELTGERRFLGAPVPAGGTKGWREWLRRDVAFAPQDARAAFDPLVRLGPQLVELSGVAAAAGIDALRRLDEPDAHDVLRRFPHQVSGGQAQRVLLAAALARAARLVVLDEPTASLDRARQSLLVAELRARMAKGAAVLVATHDGELAHVLGARSWTFSAEGVRAGTPPPPAWPAPQSLGEGREVLLRATGLRAVRGGREVLHGVDLTLHAGEVVALLGPSGAGKTTLATILAGLAAPAGGRLEPAPGRGRPVQLLFQDAYASLTPGRSVRALAAETAPSLAAVDQLAGALGLAPAELMRRARELSGGQRRRAALLRALTVAPRVLILDEPTASLDAATAAAVLAVVLAEAANRSVACLLITHDADLAHAVAHRVLVLEDGSLRATSGSNGARRCE